jgi:hypothetical protein
VIWRSNEDFKGAAMLNAHELQERIRRELGWRVGDATARYIIDRMLTSGHAAFPIFASDARTGMAIRPMFDPSRWGSAAKPVAAPQAKGPQFLLFPME